MTDGPRTVPGRMRTALRAGWAAQDAGEPRSSNPWDLRSDDVAERVLAVMWCRGWDDRNPMVILSDDDPDHDPSR